MNPDLAKPIVGDRSARWKMIALLIFAIQVSGCNLRSSPRLLPAPLRTDFPYEITGRPTGIWGGDHFQMRNGDLLHYIVMEGIVAPKRGQKFFLESKRELIRLINRKDLRVTVIGRDDHHREIGFVVLNSDERSIEQTNASKQNHLELVADPPIPMGLQMVRLGLAWYDEAEFTDADLYRASQAEAREAQRGLWSQLNPVPPWEVEP